MYKKPPAIDTRKRKRDMIHVKPRKRLKQTIKRMYFSCQIKYQKNINNGIPEHACINP